MVYPPPPCSDETHATILITCKVCTQEDGQYMMQRVDSARCLACGDDEESIEHFLLHCPSYAHERWSMGPRTNSREKEETANIGNAARRPGHVHPPGELHRRYPSVQKQR